MSDSTTCINWEVWSHTGGSGGTGATGGSGGTGSTGQGGNTGGTGGGGLWTREDATSDNIFYAGNIAVGGTGGPGRVNIWQGGIHFDSNPGIYQTHGIITTMQVGESVSFGDALRLHTNGKLYKANASNIPQEIVFCLSAETAASNDWIKVLLRGFINNPLWSFTGSRVLYLGTTDGVVSETKPGSNIQVLGIAKTSDIILFNPAYGGIGGGASGARYTTPLLTGATGYTGTHGLGEEPIIQCYNPSWVAIEPDEIRVSPTGFLVDFDEDITDCYIICIA